METLIRNIKFTRGNTYGLKINLKTSITDINDIYFTVKDGSNKKLIEKKLDNGITFEDNVIILQLKPSDTDNLIDDVDYKYDLEINYGRNDEFTIVKGKFIVGWKVTD